MNSDEAEAGLNDWLTENGPIAVAFSGGVDSALLALGAVMSAARKNAPVPAAVFKAVPAPVPGAAAPIAFFAVGPTSSAEDRETARRVADEIGIRLVEIESSEMTDPDFLRNGPDRCYHCKRIRFREMKEAVQREGRRLGLPFLLIDGENADDLAAYRPGRRAAAELGIRSPLAELGIDKETVRLLARKWGLSVADRPSTPCLATRLAYGMTPTEENLRRVEAAERFLKGEGFPVCRVRIDLPRSARIEVPAADLSRLLDPLSRSRTLRHFLELGFSVVSVDLEGFASGKMDRRDFFCPQITQIFADGRKRGG